MLVCTGAIHFSTINFTGDPAFRMISRAWKIYWRLKESGFGHDAFLCFSTRNYYGQNHKSFMTSQFVFMLFNSKACSIVLKTFIRIFVEKFLFVFLQIMHKSCWKLLFMKLLIISCFYKIKSKKKCSSWNIACYALQLDEIFYAFQNFI